MAWDSSTTLERVYSFLVVWWWGATTGDYGWKWAAKTPLTTALVGMYAKRFAQLFYRYRRCLMNRIRDGPKSQTLSPKVCP